jgi:iron complex outermembrane recepter protein
VRYETTGRQAPDQGLAVAALGVCVVFLGSGAAWAADTAPADNEQIEEVVVTAQHRAENLQNVPISATVVSGQSLVQQNLNSLLTVSQTVPSLHIDEAGRSNEMYIRGIGSGQNQGFDQSVGTFIDDVYHGRSRTSVGTFLDVDRIEVLKGPQTTFFGNNAIAGALSIVTRKPGDTFDASARALWAPNIGQYVVEAAVGGPITDSFGVRVAGTVNEQNGWLKNVSTGDEAPDQDDKAVRVTFAYKPTETLDATLKIDASDNNNKSGFAFILGNCPPVAPFVAAGFCSTALAQGAPLGSNSRQTGGSPGQQIKLSTNEDVLTVNDRLGGLTLTSVSAFYGYHYNLNLDADGLPQTLLNGQVPEKYHQFSQELRLASPTDQPIEYLAGLYFQTDKVTMGQAFTYDFLSPVISSVPPFAALIPYLPFAQNILYDQDEHTYSGFGSVNWHATDALSIGGALRLSKVDKSYNWQLLYGEGTRDYGGVVPFPAAIAPLAQAFANAPGLGTAGTLAGSRSDHGWMPSGRVQYQLDPNAMAYLTYSRGFKAGGFNPGDLTAVAANLPFGPEHVNAYELGLKSKWAEDRLLLNLAVFRSDYSDLQVSANQNTPAGAVISLVRNAAESRSEGVDLEAQWVLSSNLRLSIESTYLHAYYRDYRNVSPTTLQGFEGVTSQDLSGRPTEYAPLWSGNIAATYGVPLPGGWHFSSELRAYFSSSYFTSATDDPLQAQPAYTRLDGRLSVQSPDGRWTVDLIGTNLADRTIIAAASGWPSATGSLLLQNEQPRTGAIQVSYRY